MMLVRIAIFAVIAAVLAAGAAAATTARTAPKRSPPLVLAPPPEIVDDNGHVLARPVAFSPEARTLAAGPAYRLKQAFRATLFDYDHTEFQYVTAHYVGAPTSGIFLCGQFNPLNRLGGRIGWQGFAYIDEKLMTGPASGGIDQVCASKGGFVDTRDYTPDMRP